MLIRQQWPIMGQWRIMYQSLLIHKQLNTLVMETATFHLRSYENIVLLNW